MKQQPLLTKVLVAISLCALGSDAYCQTASAAATRMGMEPAIHKLASAPAETMRQMDEATVRVAQRVLPAVVQISVNGFGPSEKQEDGQTVFERQRGIGSGVIVDPSGYIITNAHVVMGAQRIQVIMTAVNTEFVPFQTSLLHRQRTFDAKVIGIHRMTDLALLKIDAKELPFMPLEEAYTASLGQSVLAVGTPEGLDHTITRGIVSALGRQPDLDDPMIYIQTDAPINPGNSGGALVDRDGSLVGINTFILSQGGGSEGLGFAIPEATVKFVYEELREYGYVRRTVIGANAQTITPTLAAGLKLSQDWGVIISDVTPHGPADNAGLKPKDIVVAVDNRVIDSLPSFTACLFLHRHGEPVQMDVLRKGETVKLYIPDFETHSGIQMLTDLIDPKTGVISSLGIFVVELNESTAASLPKLRSSSGVIVAATADTPRIDVALSVGDVIRSVNGIVLKGASDLRSELERLKPGDPVVLEIERQGSYQFVSFEME